MNAPHIRFRGEPRISLAVFGKHPGWDDHIEDLGHDSARLIQARRVLYVQGIGGAIESGVWDKLEQEGKAIPFHHVVVWHFPESLVIGRMWASRDGKGRERYPMLALVECCGLSLERALADILPRLASLEERCIALVSAAEVRALVETMRGELRGRAERGPGEDGLEREPERPGERLAYLAGRPDWGPDGLGLWRVLHKMYREWAVYAPGSAGASKASRPSQLRVPRCAETLERAAALWGRALGDQVDPSAPRLLLLPVHAPWLDLLVGPPGPAQLYCLRASTDVLPLTSDVPYTWDDEFSRRVEAVLADARRPGTDEVSIFGPAPRGAGRLDGLAQGARRWWKKRMSGATAERSA